MSSWRSVAAGVASLALTAAVAATERFPGIGRTATESEVRAWDIDVRPDFKGLPKGSGTVAKGQDVWETKCASCHGIFGESNQFFSPIVGGTTQADIKSGRVARLTDEGFPQRTTLMKVATLSTLWDYVNRAMPWNAPKTLSTEEVYAVVAYMLHLGDILPADFTLSDANIAEVQKRMPNRYGMSTAHAMWPGSLPGATAKPDVSGQACMSNCAGEPKIATTIPDYARDAHGNLAEQNRLVGPQRGAVTVQATAAGPAKASGEDEGMALAKHLGCTSCHNMDSRLVGPSFKEIGKKHGARQDAVAYLSSKARQGGSGVWGSIPMPPQSLSDADAKAIAEWLARKVKQ